MDAIKVPKLFFAEAIADALAIIHWEAGIDGRDIEFIIGSAPSETTKTYTMPIKPGQSFDDALERNFQKRRNKLWVIDFNQCRRFPRTIEGCEDAAQAFWDNEPYYPRPDNSNPDKAQLWDCFEETYIRRSNLILQDCRTTIRLLPSKFISRVKEIYQERHGGTSAPLAPPRTPPRTPPTGPARQAKKKSRYSGSAAFTSLEDLM